jgi:adenosylcobinamide-GDP ribazoletransferase
MRRALAFLTPVGRGGVPTPRTFDWFPLVGAIIGLAVGGVWWLADRAWAPIVGAGVTVVVDVVLTGGLHLDGLADAADGLLPPMDRARRLQVLRDPAVGAFGGVALVAVLLLRFGAFATTPVRPLVVAGLWCGSRTAMAVMARSMPYARTGGGLATAFVIPSDGGAGTAGTPSAAPSRWGPGSVLAMVGGVVLAAVLAAVGRGAVGLAAVAAEAVAAAGVGWLAWRRIGGFTGDVLGAAGVIGETVGLLVMAAK